MNRNSEKSWLGDAQVTGAALAFSTAGLFTGAIGADVWTMLFWRGLVGGVVILGTILWLNDASGRSIGRAGLVVAACSTIATICFIHSLRRTTVADVTIIYATAPFLAAAIAWLWMRQRAGRVTLVAALLALFGVVLMMGQAASTGNLVGNLLALAMTVLMALMMVVIRRNDGVSMVPASCLSAFASAAIALPLASPIPTSGSAFVLLVLFGVQFGVGLLLLTIGSRRIPAVRTALLANLELPLAPVWVWLAFNEVPSTMTWLGGAVVCAAILLDTFRGDAGAT